MTPWAVAEISPEVRCTAPTGNGQGEHLRIVGNGAIGRTGERVVRVFEACIVDTPFLSFGLPFY